MWFNRCFLSWILLVVIGMAACSGGDTEVEVTQEPEPVEDVIPEPTPEPEVIYSGPFDFLESWADISYGAEISCNDRVFTKSNFPDLQVTRWNNPNPITTQWHVRGAPVCDYDKFYPTYELLTGSTTEYRKRIDLSMRYPDRDGTKFYSGPGAFFFVNNRTADRKTRTSGEKTITEWAVGGDVYGRFDPESQEAIDRKQLAEDCGRSAQYVPDVVVHQLPYFDIEEGDVFEGEWQAVRTVTTEPVEDDDMVTTELELCVKLDTMPGAVKCVVSEYDGDVNLFEVSKSTNHEVTDTSHKVVLYLDGEDDPITVVSDINGDYTPNALGLYNQINGQPDYPRANRLCHLFDDDGVQTIPVSPTR